ncbi:MULTISPECIES: TIGR04211 family SH3 domain-containing protein [Vibrio]|uniref:SH3 domain-containing protein n=2 Tax=Vibrio TaxID=662 RepID=A0A7X4LIZ9_9VIBR|nr:TIGR04211 family SH3 domain-containing protein [Vibrio nitrifigilis]MBF9001618.1 SH3 domain-containing protein [Vibrio nitrifigilis]MZI92521.1 SH3 domain-containing protein [Vibrio eleionomae]
MKKLLCMVLFSLIAAPVFAQNRYISDELFTYMHSGPTNEYRIIGSVNAGEKVNLVEENKDTGFSKVVDEKGRTGWVESRYVTQEVSRAIRLPQLEKELSSVKAKLATASKSADEEKAGLQEALEVRNKQISELEKNYGDISKQLTESQSEVRKLRARLDTQKEDLLLKYFMYGGGVAGIGLIFGLVLPHIVPRRKRKPSGWA